MNYIDQIKQWYRKEKPQGGVSIARIEHDDWCDFWKNGGCNCDPKVIISKVAAGGGEAGETKK